jgi:hypothetical protein
MHEAEKYLRETSGYLYVRYHGEKRRLFIAREDDICMVRKGEMNWGDSFSDWEGITKIYFPKNENEENEQNLKLVEKYRREASKATFTNDFIRDCLSADANKSLYENRITTGNRIDGKIISLASIAERKPYAIKEFQEAMKKCINSRSCRFSFRGYECSLHVTVNEQNEAMGSFAMEYKNCGNGYYYLLINDENFIGYDID